MRFCNSARDANNRQRKTLSEFEFDGAIVQEAMQATFARRQTAFLTPTPLALTDEFINDKGKQTQWRAFLRKNRLEGATERREVIELLQRFFLPIIESHAHGKIISAQWLAGNWKE